MSITTQEPEPRVLARPDHNISRSSISTNALKVMYRLHRAGYDSYLVGGAVRDILLGRRPKDFDVGTNARPQEIRRLFRNSRIIGRRFRLVHVLFRGETVEVSTFRASAESHEEPPDWESDEESRAEEEEHGAPVASEVEDSFGTPEEDARRRDFTVNGLFYNIADFSVIDLVGGLDDLQAGLIRTIGEPGRRFAEDPVRMMRALEYAERLGFTLDPQAAEAINASSVLITEAAPARLSYELLEGLRSGHAAGIIDAWRRFGIMERAFPDLEGDRKAVCELLARIDELGELGAQMSDASLIGVFFLPRFMSILKDVDRREGKFDNTSLLRELRELLEPAAGHLHLANHTAHLVYQALFSLSKMRAAPRRGRQVLKLARQDYFNVAWDLFNLGTQVGYFEREVLRGWARALDRVKKYGAGADPQQIVEQEGPRPGGRKRRRRRRPRRRRKES